MAHRYDWEAIELDYRTGRYSLAQLSERHGPNRASISKKATREGWAKDLTAPVAQRTREKLSRPESAPLDLPESDVIEQVASENADIARGHRRLLGNYRKIADRFITQLGDQLDRGKREVQLANGDVMEIDLDLEYIGKCMGHGTQALERVIKMERQSYRLDAEEGDEPPERNLSDDEIEQRIEALQRKAGRNA